MDELYIVEDGIRSGRGVAKEMDGSPFLAGPVCLGVQGTEAPQGGGDSGPGETPALAFKWRGVKAGHRPPHRGLALTPLERLRSCSRGWGGLTHPRRGPGGEGGVWGSAP